MRFVWFAIGWLAVAIGGIGVVVPGLPTTVFMVIAASCFAKSSPRFEQWVLDLPGVGPSVAAYRRGEGMPRRAKVVALTMLTVAVSISAFITSTRWWLSAIIVVAGLVGWWFITMRVPTRPDDADG